MTSQIPSASEAFPVTFVSMGASEVCKNHCILEQYLDVLHPFLTRLAAQECLAVKGKSHFRSKGILVSPSGLR